jgi:hypothetical protein
MEYNTTREHLTLPEYGRNVQKMIQHAMTVEDRTERNNAAEEIIRVMGQLNPQLRDISEYNHILWDHLFIMSKFELDVDSPYPKPDAESGKRPPDRIAYPDGKMKYKHYGKNIPAYIASAIAMEDGEEKKELVRSIANMMKRAYLNWNRDSVNDEVIVEQLKSMSDGKLVPDAEFEFESTRSIMGSGFKQNTNKKKSSYGKGKRKRQRR